MSFKPFALTLLALFAASAFGQATPQGDPIGTSRPSFSDTSQIVPVRSLQLEAGLSLYRRGGREVERWELGEALFRYGLAPRAELRLQLPNDVLPRQGVDGFDNTILAASFYLGQVGGWDVGVVPGVEIPSGARPYRDETLTPNASLNLGRSFGKTGVAATLAAAYGRDQGRADLSGQGSLVVTHALGPSRIGFVEYAAFLDRFDQPEHYAHLGLQWIVHRTSQFDVHAAVGLGGAASHEVVGAGYSVRF